MGARLSTYHLLRYHDNGLDGELAVAVVEQVLQAGPEQVDDQDVVEAFLAKVIDIRDPGCTRLAEVDVQPDCVCMDTTAAALG
jgi:hypothetical protein